MFCKRCRFTLLLSCRAWDQPGQLASTTAHCVEATQAYLYDNYIGDSSASQQSNSAYFQQSGWDRKYGWIGRDCSNLRQ